MFDGVSASAAENMRQPSASEKQSSKDDGAFAALIGEARRDEPRAERATSKDDVKTVAQNPSSKSSDETDPTPNQANETSASESAGLIQLAHIQTQFAAKSLPGSKSSPLQSTQQTGLSQQTATPAVSGDQAGGVDAELTSTFKKVLNSGAAANQNATPQKAPSWRVNWRK